MNAKELYAHIQSLTVQMDNKEKERFYDEAEKRVFNQENRIDVDLSFVGYIFYDISHISKLGVSELRGNT